MCLTSAGKCRTLCQMCAPMLESELHELNCLSAQKNSSNRDVASSSVPTQTIFCICKLWQAGFKAVQLQDINISVQHTTECRHSLRARQTFCQCQAKVRDSIKDDNNNSSSNANAEKIVKISQHKYKCRRFCLKKSARICPKKPALHRCTSTDDNNTGRRMQILKKLSSLSTLHSCPSRNWA